MPVPRSREARDFYRCAYQRFDDAQLLLHAHRTTGAVYLAGYVVECILKTLVLSGVPSRRAKNVLQAFRGHRAHDYEWLRALYRQDDGPDPPRDVRISFTLVNRWSTDLRYSTEITKERDAQRFLKATEAILTWADGRLG
jgi:hypothetical protein